MDLDSTDIAMEGMAEMSMLLSTTRASRYHLYWGWSLGMGGSGTQIYRIRINANGSNGRMTLIERAVTQINKKNTHSQDRQDVQDGCIEGGFYHAGKPGGRFTVTIRTLLAI
jgi:hypothetical protein